MNPALKTKTTPIIEIHSTLFREHDVRVYVKLDFMNHPEVQGNKWHKLKLNLQQAIKQNKSSLLTFGGAYSNHIAATAAAAKLIKRPSLGIIRGEELSDNPQKWSHTLKKAHADGMQLKFVTRQEYRKRTDTDYLKGLQEQYPNSQILPEGGSNNLAIDGFSDLCMEINRQCPNWTQLFTAVGTGGTLAGFSSYAYAGENTKIATKKQVFGVSALKNSEHLLPQIQKWIKQRTGKLNFKADWKLLTEYHCGGYAKQNPELLEFIDSFETNYKIPLEPIYTSKTFLAFFKMLKQGNIPKKSNVILYHSGGLQGNKI